MSSLKKHAGIFASASVLTQLLSVVSAILIRRFLGTWQMGLWSLIQLILSYTEYLGLGANNTIVREIPYHRGAQDNAKANRLKNLVVSLVMLLTIFGALGLIIFVIFCRHHLGQHLPFVLLCVAGLMVLQRFNNLLIEICRAHKVFSVLSRQMFYSALLNLALILFFVANFKIYGLLLAIVLSMLFNIFYLMKNYPFYLHWEFQQHEISGLVAYGFPLMSLRFLESILSTLDRFLITRFLGLDSLGIYSIAIMSATYLDSIPNAIGVVMIPNLQEEYGSHRDMKLLKGSVDKWFLAYCYIMPILIISGAVLIPWLINWLLPKFCEGLNAMRCLLFSVFFMTCGTPYYQFLIGVKKHFRIFPLTAFCLIVMAFMIFIAIKLGWGLAGVASAVACGYFFQFTLIFFTAGSYLYTFPEMIKRFSFFCGITFYLAVALFVLYLLQQNASTSITDVMKIIGIGGLICLPFGLRLNKQYALIQKFGAFCVKNLQSRMFQNR